MELVVATVIEISFIGWLAGVVVRALDSRLSVVGSISSRDTAWLCIEK